MDSLIWTMVPNGRVLGTQKTLRANIAILPRLTSASLAAAGMANWPPEALATATLRAEFTDRKDGSVHPAKVTLRLAAEPGLWQRYFPADTPIVPDDEAEPEQREIVVHRTGQDGAAAEQIFHDAAIAPLAEEGERHRAIAATVSASMERNVIGDPPAPPGPRVARFAAREAVPDFHDMLGLLREHPTVCKALGLILPVEIELPAVALSSAGTIRIYWDDAPAGLPEILSPGTAYELTDVRFLPASTPTIEAGMAKLGEAAAVGERLVAGEAGWRVLTVDADSAGEAMRGARVRALRAARNGEAAAEPLPALRTGGIAIARIGLDADMNARHAALRANRVAARDSEITADDLLLGYRLDVQRGDGKWQSLSVRNATYAIDGMPLVVGAVEEEGHIKAGAALDHGDGKLVTDEIVARWTGWSVTIKRPSFTVDPATDAADYRLSWAFAPVPGRLPRLRFGASYRMRMRVADIAGGGLALDDPLAERQITKTIAFGRFEPISSPQLTSPDTDQPPLPGETDTDLILRSDRNLTPDQFAAANPAYAAKAVRILTPPLASIAMAEQHQMFDNESPEESWKKVSAVLTGDDPKSRLALPDPAGGGIAAFESGMAAPVPNAWQKWPSLDPRQIIVLNSTDPLQPVLGWRDNDLAVSLPQAAEAQVEISSTLREHFEGHMAALLNNVDAVAAARAGRHPMVTPALTVRVTHATRMPLLDPVGTITANREKGETKAELIPSVALFGIDPESTAKIEVSADWSEPDDATTVKVEGRIVKNYMIDRGAQALPEALIHEFGDTRHRAIRYSVKAVSRFRHCFFDNEPDEWFAAVLRTDAEKLIQIPNSAVPPIPNLLRALPSFHWTIDDQAAPAPIVHQRDALIRIELARPWFTTGEGEQLAILVAMDGAPQPGLETFVSEAGRDPIWQSGTPKRWLGADDFSLAAGPAVTVTPEEASGSCLAVPHAVTFDADRDLWYCDIAFNTLAAASYAPLVRLAVARYQPVSLDGLSLSRVIRTDFTPLLPGRTLKVERSGGDAIHVRLDGVGPGGGNAVEFVVETATGAVDPDGPTILGPDAELATGWRMTGAPILAQLGEDTVVQLPNGVNHMRLRVSEFENVQTRSGVDSHDMNRRVVYSDLVPLT